MLSRSQNQLLVIMKHLSKKENVPTLLGVNLLALLMAYIGAALGFFYLASIPAQAYTEKSSLRDDLSADGNPPYSKPGDAFYFTAPVSRDNSWERRVDELKQPGAREVMITAGEINGWLSAGLGRLAWASNIDDAGIVITPGVPNVAIVEDFGMYINLPFSMSIFGSKQELTLTTVGYPSTRGFVMESVSLGNAKIPAARLLGPTVAKALIKAYRSTEEYQLMRDVIERAQAVALEAGAVRLSFR